MSSRSENMRLVNETRSEVTNAMLSFLDELDEGTGGDYHGFECWGINNVMALKGQLNTYRAQTVAQFLGKTISKQRLLKYKKPQGYDYQLSNKDLRSWLLENKEELINYWLFHKGVFTKGRG